MKNIAVPLLLTIHEVVLVALPLSYAAYFLLSQPTLYDGRAIQMFTKNGSSLTWIICVALAACVGELALSGARLFICFKSFSSLYVRTLVFRYFLLFCLAFIVIDLFTLSALGIGSLSQKPTSDSSNIVSEVTVKSNEQASELPVTSTQVRTDGSVQFTGNRLITPSIPFLIYLFLTIFFYRRSLLDKRLRVEGAPRG